MTEMRTLINKIRIAMRHELSVDELKDEIKKKSLNHMQRLIKSGRLGTIRPLLKILRGPIAPSGLKTWMTWGDSNGKDSHCIRQLRQRLL